MHGQAAKLHGEDRVLPERLSQLQPTRQWYGDGPAGFGVTGSWVVAGDGGMPRIKHLDLLAEGRIRRRVLLVGPLLAYFG